MAKTKYSSPEAERFFTAFDRAVDRQPSDIRTLTEAHGFEVAHTGGGCLAYEREDAGMRVMLTGLGGVELPGSPDEASMFGFYNGDNEWICGEAATAAQFISVRKTLTAHAEKYLALAPDGALEVPTRDLTIPLGEWLDMAEAAGVIAPDETAAVAEIRRTPPAPTP